MQPFAKVLEPIKQVFKQFPLKTFPPVEKATVEEKTRLKSLQFPFGNCSHDFKLGVYNLFDFEGVKLATDPICLNTQLGVCLKNNATLPVGSSEGQAGASVMILSYHATEDGELPVLVEGYEKRYIRSNKSIQEIQKTRVDDCHETMLMTLLDTVVYDAWMTSILYCKDSSLVLKLYTHGMENTILRRMVLQPLLQSLLDRMGYSLRNPDMASHISDWSSVVKGKGRVHAAQQLQYDNAQNVLDDFSKMLGPDQFLGGEKPNYVDIKLASYSLLFSELNSVLKIDKRLASHAKRVVLQFKE